MNNTKGRFIIATDIDGTLLDTSSEILPENEKELQRLKDQGHVIVLATGRMCADGERIAIRMPGMVDYLVSSNGASIKDLRTGEIIYNKMLKKSVCRVIIDALVSSNSFHRIYTDYEIYATEMEGYLKKYIETMEQLPPEYRFKITIGGGADRLVEEENILKIGINHMRSDQDREDINMIKAIPGIEVLKSHSRTLDIMCAGVSKASALEYLAQKEGIDPKNIFAAGDEDNDTEMIRRAGIGVAMGNATEGPMEAADYVTANNNDSGLALALKKFF